MPLVFQRYYNSYGFYTSRGAAESVIGQIGAFWRSNFDRALSTYTGTTYTIAAAHRPDGHVKIFKLNGGTWTAESDDPDRLVQLGGSAGWQYVTADDTVETYDAQFKLISIKDRKGLTQTLTYSDSSTPSSVAPRPGLLIRVSDDWGRQLQFTYNTLGLVQTMADPAGGVYQYAYDPADNLQSVTRPDQTTRQYLYNEPANTANTNHPNELTGIIDEQNVRFATYKYDNSGRAISTEHAGGADKVTVSYGSPAAVSEYKDSVSTASVTRYYGYTTTAGKLRPSYVTEPNASGTGSVTSSTTYDAAGNIATRTDLRGIQTKYTIDPIRNLESSRTEAFGTPRARTITTQWHATYRLPTQIDEPGKRTTYTHDADGNVLTRTELDTSTNVWRTWTYTYNSVGQVLTADGPRTDASDVTTYTYYSCATGYQCGQVHTVTNAAGHVTVYDAYNAHGQPLTITDPNGVVTTLAYDPFQRLKSRTIGAEATTFTYWPTGLLKKATLPDSSYLEYSYDAAHRLTDISDAEGNRIHYTLDLKGNRTGEQAYDPSNVLTRTRARVFNALNQLQKEIGAAGTVNVTTTFDYDNNSNQTGIHAPLSRNTIQAYDELNRLKQVTDPLNGVTDYGYNALDQLISVTDPKRLVTSYQYNALGDLKQQTSPDTGVTANTYDSAGNLKTSTDARNVVTTYTYDALNRVATASFTLGSTTDQTLTYSYDAGTYGKGRFTGISDADHSLDWTYDEQGRVLTATQIVGSVSKTTSYSYLNGLRQSMTTPSGQLITYGYTNGKITSISVNGTPLVSNVLYEPFGPVRQWTWGNGTLSVRTFDDDGKITQIDSSGLKDYTYDDAFRITGITDTSDPSLSWTYGYDKLDRLESANKPGTTLGYRYDANGNREAQTGTAASAFTIDSNSNRLTSIAGALTRTYGYDTAGNTTSYDGITFTYNNRGRMKSSTKNGVTTNYKYNALGQLIQKGTSALYYYDEAGHMLGIYDDSGALTEEIVWLGDIPLATLRPRTGGGIDVYYIHSDHLNTPRIITDITNTPRWLWGVEPFGNGMVGDNPSGIGVFNFNLRFPGQIEFAETRLYYNYFRDYDPATGRYVQSDPIGLDGGQLNTYAYVASQPLRFSDPLGLWLPAMHRRMSQEAAAKSCPKIAAELGRLTAGVDALENSQLPVNSFWHAMSDGRSGQSSDEARAQFDEYIGRNAASCDLGELARALHAVQDSFSPAHRGFKSWSGFRQTNPFRLMWHGLQDTFANPGTYDQAVAASASIVAAAAAQCNCLCGT